MTSKHFALIITLLVLIIGIQLYQNIRLAHQVSALTAQVSDMSDTVDNILKVAKDADDEAEQAHQRADDAATHLGE